MTKAALRYLDFGLLLYRFVFILVFATLHQSRNQPADRAEYQMKKNRQRNRCEPGTRFADLVYQIDMFDDDTVVGKRTAIATCIWQRVGFGDPDDVGS